MAFILANFSDLLMHQILHEWLELGRDFQLRIVFTVKNTDSDLQTPISRHLMALNQLADREVIKTALHDWYKETIKYAEWAKKYPVEITSDSTNF